MKRKNTKELGRTGTTRLACRGRIRGRSFGVLQRLDLSGEVPVHLRQERARYRDLVQPLKDRTASRCKRGAPDRGAAESQIREVSNGRAGMLRDAAGSAICWSIGSVHYRKRAASKQAAQEGGSVMKHRPRQR